MKRRDGEGGSIIVIVFVAWGASTLACTAPHAPHDHDASRPDSHDTLAEWAKAPDSSSGGAIRVGSNPTADSGNLYFFSRGKRAAWHNENVFRYSLVG